MEKIIEISIVFVALVLSAGFLIWVNVKSIKNKSACTNCPMYKSCKKNNDKNKIDKKTLSRL